MLGDAGSKSVRGAISLAVCVLVLVSCAEDAPVDAAAPSQVQESPDDESKDPTTSDAPEPEVADSLKFAAKTVDGQPFKAKSLAGKDVVLWFWAPWCTECRREAPHVAAVQKANADDVTFVGVAGLGPVNDMKAFVADYRVGAFGHLADVDGKIWKRFGVVEQPAHAFIDEDGTVELVRGEMDRQGLADRVDDLIAD